MYMDKEMQTTPVFLPGEIHGQTWQATVHGVVELDMTEQLLLTHSGVQHSDSVFLYVILHLKLLQNNGFIPHAVQYSLVFFLYIIVFIS